jgi:hypothetical protein
LPFSDVTESALLAEKYSRETSSQRNLPTIFYTDLGTLDSSHVLWAFNVKKWAVLKGSE